MKLYLSFLGAAASLVCLLALLIIQPETETPQECGKFYITTGSYMNDSKFEADSIDYITPNVAKIYVNGLTIAIYGHITVRHKKCKDD